MKLLTKLTNECVTFNEDGTTSPGPIFFREKLNPPTKDGSTGFWNRWRNCDWGLLSFLAAFLPVKLANWEKKPGVVKCCKNGFWVQYGVCLYVPHWKFVKKWPRHPPSKFRAFSPIGHVNSQFWENPVRMKSQNWFRVGVILCLVISQKSRVGFFVLQKKMIFSQLNFNIFNPLEERLPAHTFGQ